MRWDLRPGVWQAVHLSLLPSGIPLGHREGEGREGERNSRGGRGRQNGNGWKTEESKRGAKRR